ncbi:MAG: hypothetical protein ACC656_10170, partial [Candidatus Heimdallarchaeota archaeon]
IQDSTFQSNQQYYVSSGVYLSSTTNITFVNEIVSYVDNNVFLITSSNQISINNSEISNSKAGINVGTSSDLIVSGNNFDTVTTVFVLGGNVNDLTSVDNDFNLYILLIAFTNVIDSLTAFNSNYYSDYSGSGEYKVTEDIVDTNPDVAKQYQLSTLTVTSSADQILELGLNTNIKPNDVTWTLSSTMLNYYMVTDTGGNIVSQGFDHNGLITIGLELLTVGLYSYTLMITDFQGQFKTSTVEIAVGKTTQITGDERTVITTTTVISTITEDIMTSSSTTSNKTGSSDDGFLAFNSFSMIVGLGLAVLIYRKVRSNFKKNY